MLTFRSRLINFPPHHHIGEHIIVNFDANEPKRFRNLCPKSSYAYRFNSDSLRTSSPRCQMSLNIKEQRGKVKLMWSTILVKCIVLSYVEAL
jgi:hypothetical protein